MFGPGLVVPAEHGLEPRFVDNKRHGDDGRQRVAYKPSAKMAMDLSKMASKYLRG